MSVSQKHWRDERHSRAQDPERDAALRWLADQLRWEDVLAGLHDRRAGRRRPPRARDAA